MQTTMVTIAGRSFPVGKLTLGAIRKNPRVFAAFQRRLPSDAKAINAEQLEGMILVTFLAIDQPNDSPQISFDEFSALLDTISYDDGLDQVTGAFAVAMGTAGLEKSPEGEAVAGTATGSSRSPDSAASTA